ncbi:MULTISPECIES: Flp family type IVb pilin [unclassified Halomonas]|uniref:Flp family type IVb pilin n=1 Tax=unclassified Halomonas TaxID=2609666 RepID=UPI001C946338|nr:MULTISPECIES: Flp family type IVb pilin [unclassified Halomonas]MBY5926363.1 Flp family type IVb pilin [Halomonas sp. DP4Y7-2]MBY6233405.1 Flp family type IVb pilin [Halomonas sp. DP4Y7-1]
MKKFPLFFAKPLCPKAVKVAARHPQHRRQRGASAIEYAIILAVITVVIIGVLQTDSFTEGLSGLAADIGNLFPGDDSSG